MVWGKVSIERTTVDKSASNVVARWKALLSTVNHLFSSKVLEINERVAKATYCKRDDATDDDSVACTDSHCEMSNPTFNRLPGRSSSIRPALHHHIWFSLPYNTFIGLLECTYMSQRDEESAKSNGKPGPKESFASELYASITHYTAFTYHVSIQPHHQWLQ